MPDNKEPDSPCIGICLYDFDIGACIGCWRTMYEIEEWEDMSEQERKEAMAIIAIRKINGTH